MCLPQRCCCAQAARPRPRPCSPSVTVLAVSRPRTPPRPCPARDAPEAASFKRRRSEAIGAGVSREQVAFKPAVRSPRRHPYPATRPRARPAAAATRPAAVRATTPVTRSRRMARHGHKSHDRVHSTYTLHRKSGVMVMIMMSDGDGEGGNGCECEKASTVVRDLAHRINLV